MLIPFLGALLTGVCLGLLGSGGSILTIPILHYLLHRPEKLAIAESLAIVGFIALIGAIPYAFKKLIAWKSVILFGLPGMFGAYMGAWSSGFLSGSTQIVLFSFIMLVVAGGMLRGSEKKMQQTPKKCPAWLTIVQGLFIGFITGLIGCGGGFIIVPALVLLGHLSMITAVGTSLLIITANSWVGFFKQWMILDSNSLEIDWNVIFIFSIFGMMGSIMGGFFSNLIPQEKLKQCFGLTVLIAAFFILYQKLG